MNISLLIGLLIFMPLLGGIIFAIAFISDKNSYFVKSLVADLIVAIEFVVSLYLLISQASLAFTLNEGYVSELSIPRICGFGLNFGLDGFRIIYSLIASFMWLVSTIIANEYCKAQKHTTRFYAFMMLTLGATQGVFLSTDFYTTFIFFEIMSFTSFVWVAQEETKGALRAANTYLAIAVVGGLTTLMGIFILYYKLQTVDFIVVRHLLQDGAMDRTVVIAGFLILIGFAAKAGAFPLHVWLPKAHPVAPAPASALLSGILTKTGIFGMLVISSYILFDNLIWSNILLFFGLVTMFGGALLALFSVDLKRTLACSSMSQIGFIMTGVAGVSTSVHNPYLAYHGALLHMVNHSLIKLLLFCVAGVVYMNCHSLELNRIKGFGKKKPLLMVLYLIGALSISGIPGFSGYISKTLLHENIVENFGGSFGTFAEIIFLATGGMTLAYMTKLFFCLFIDNNDSDELQTIYIDNTKIMSKTTLSALCLAGAVLFVFGLLPYKLMGKASALMDSFIVFHHEIHVVHYFSLECLKGGIISITIGMLLYYFVVRKYLIRNNSYIDLWPKWLDLEEILYRPLVLSIIPTILAVVFRVLDSLVDYMVVLFRKTILADMPLPKFHNNGVWYTEVAGRLMNLGKHIVNIKRFIFKEPYNTKNYVKILAVKYNNSRLSYQLIRRSLSFGLLMFGLGFMLTMAYLLLG